MYFGKNFRMDVFPLNHANGGSRIECQAPSHYPRTFF